jgi:hypothetical protein
MSFVEVLPIEPVIATNRARLRSRTRPASVWNECRGCPAREGVLDEVGAAADRDEQVALLDPARVRLQPGHLRGPRRCLELPRGELGDFGE